MEEETTRLEQMVISEGTIVCGRADSRVDVSFCPEGLIAAHGKAHSRAKENSEKEEVARRSHQYLFLPTPYPAF